MNCDESGVTHNILLDAALRKSYDIDFNSYCDSLKKIWFPLPNVPPSIMKYMLEHCALVDIVGTGFEPAIAPEERSLSVIESIRNSSEFNIETDLLESAESILRDWSNITTPRSEFSVVDRLSGIPIQGEMKDAIVSIALSSTSFSQYMTGDSSRVSKTVGDDVAGAVLGVGGGLAGSIVMGAAFSVIGSL